MFSNALIWDKTSRDDAVNGALLVLEDQIDRQYAQAKREIETGRESVRAIELRKLDANRDARLAELLHIRECTEHVVDSLKKLSSLHPDMTLWLKMDTWTSEQGALLIAGIIPEPNAELRAERQRIRASWSGEEAGTTPFTGHMTAWGLCLWSDYGWAFPTWGDKSLLFIGEAAKKCNQVALLWESGPHAARCSPEYFLAWAKSKGIAVEWEERARADGLLPERSTGSEEASQQRVTATQCSVVDPLAKAVTLRIGKNSNALWKQYVEQQDAILRVAGESLDALAGRIHENIPEGALGERGRPLSLATIRRLISETRKARKERDEQGN